MPHDFVLARLLSNNAQWAKDVEDAHPGFFEDLANKPQEPKVLWIGCADSRVPESVITASMPGDIFVHRNIANQFHTTDDNAFSVLSYAVEHVKVTHIIVVGHTKCGGVAAAHAAAQECPPHEPTDALERWLEPLTELARTVDIEGDDLTPLVEANVRQQVENVAESEVLREAWAAGKYVKVHGWVYDLERGRLRDLGITVGKQ